MCSPTDKLHDGAHQRGEDELGEEDHGADDGHVRADAAHLAADHGRDVPRRLLLLGPRPRLRVASLPVQITPHLCLVHVCPLLPDGGQQLPDLAQEPRVLAVDGVRLVVVCHLQQSTVQYSTVQYYAVQCSYQEVGHGEEGGVHDPRCPGEDQDRPLGAGECEADHAGGVDQLAADVDGLGAEPGHHLVQEEGVAGAGEAVHGHAPACEPHPLVIQHPPRAPLRLPGHGG